MDDWIFGVICGCLTACIIIVLLFPLLYKIMMSTRNTPIKDDYTQGQKDLINRIINEIILIEERNDGDEMTEDMIDFIKNLKPKRR